MNFKSIPQTIPLGVLAIAAFLAMPALAAPSNGFGINGGYVSTSRDCGGCSANNSSGFTLGIDYQFAISERLSISPFLQSSSETSSAASGITIGHGVGGAELRYWSGNVFTGVHLAEYSEVGVSGPFAIGGTGLGAGVVVGWESPNNGLYYMGQLDSATVRYSGIRDIGLTGFRLSAGYRFK